MTFVLNYNGKDRTKQSKMSKMVFHLFSHVIISYHYYFDKHCKLTSIPNLKGEKWHECFLGYHVFFESLVFITNEKVTQRVVQAQA